MRGLIITGAALAWAVSAVGSPVGAQLAGDSAAVAVVSRMMDTLGGEEVWRRARTLELVYRALSTSTPNPVVERAWRDLRVPVQRIEVEAGGSMVTSVLTPDLEWRRRGDAVETLPLRTLARDLLFWHKDFYTLLRRLAVQDPDLWVEGGEGRRVVVYSERHGELGWFEVDATGAPLRWGTTDGGEPLEYVYGPLRNFDGLPFPAWGSSLDGSWRFEYESVALSVDSIAPEMLARPR